MTKWFESEKRYKCLWCGTTDRYHHTAGCKLTQAIQQAATTSLKYRLKLGVKKFYRSLLDTLKSSL